MRKTTLIVSCFLLSHSLIGEAGQKNTSYPKSAHDVIILAETLSRVDYSVNEAIKHFGTVNPTNRDDEVSLSDVALLLTPFASDRNDIKRVVLYTFDDKRGAKRALDSVSVDYIKPIQVSYGELVKQYGEPVRLPLPRVRCRPGVNCHPAFVGYGFRLVPGPRDTNPSKRLEVYISLEMEWSKVLPQHTAKDFLAVKSVQFKRIWRSEASAARLERKECDHAKVALVWPAIGNFVRVECPTRVSDTLEEALQVPIDGPCVNGVSTASR